MEYASAVDFLARAIAAHEKVGLEFPQVFDEYFTFHWVIKTPTSFLMAREDPARPDAWLVYWADTSETGQRLSPILHFLNQAPYDKPFVCWARALRGRLELRYYSTARLRRLISPPSGQ